MPISDRFYLHALNLLLFLGPRRLVRLHNHFGSYQAAYQASIIELCEAGVDAVQANQIIEHRALVSVAYEMQKLIDEGITIVQLQDDDYPKLLAEIPDPPALLYVRGHLPPADAVMVSVVGTRNVTTYGRSVTPELVQKLAQSGIVIVSGLAFGVDALAHQTCVNVKAPTIAVLGSGVDAASVYPRAHSLLADEILAGGGALVSEYPPGTPSLKQNFVARNRIISGLTVGALVVEANFKSGALITAKHALDQNRNVYAVPGPIYAQASEGPNNLIKLGAKLVINAADILDDLHVTANTATMSTSKLELPPHEKIIFDLLNFEPKSADELVAASKLDVQTVATTLTYLEIKGLVHNVGAGQYVRSHR